MKKLLIILTSLSLFGCGIIKKDKQRSETETKSVLNASKTDKTHEIGGSTILRPFNPEKGIVYGKDTIYNATIEKHYYDRTKVVADTIHKTQTQVIEVESKHKETDNTAVFKELFYHIVILIVSLFLIALAYYHFTKPKV